MAPSAVDSRGRMTNGVNGANGDVQQNGANGTIDTMNPHDYVRFDPSLQPKSYHMKGTDANSKVLFREVNIIDSTGREPFKGDVYIEGERIKYVGEVPNIEDLARSASVRTIPGKGRTLMSGLGDAHTHFSWNNGDLGRLGELGVEEHTLMTARSAQCYIDSGYTMCYGAASAKERLDCVIRDAINEGNLPGPRYLANGKEMAVPDGELVPGITAFAKGPLEMREVIRHHIGLGVDNIKLSMSGEQICETRDAQDCYYTDDETAACVDEAHRHGVRLCAHARARDSVKMCVKHGVDIIYHASWIDDEGMEMLDRNKHKHIVAPGLNWLIATLYDAAAFGYSHEKAEQVGYKKELDAAIPALKEMHRRGITVLPGGDYGFAWTPHGTYARDLEHFVKLLGFTPMESIVAATAGVAKLFMREDELGKIKPGYFADCILVDGNPLDNISVLQEHDKLNVIMINGRIHKASYKEFAKVEQPDAVIGAREEVKLNRFVAYVMDDGTERTRIGHLDQDKSTITPLAYKSGTAIENLYQLIEVGEENIIAGGDRFKVTDEVNILPPLAGRDVIAVGKNYKDHVRETGNELPKVPVVFTKRQGSIIANEDDILWHEGFTEQLDYEGEIGVIIGKAAHRVSETEASNYVWGYTIVNDVSAREKQKAHQQTYIGKGADSYCPMGPLAVPKSAVPDTLTLTTHVNGELRQKGSTADFIFSIPSLISTLSESQTLRPGDVISTGTPAGVAMGMTPPKWLKPGDVVEVVVTGLGTLRNRVVQAEPENHVTRRLRDESSIPMHNLSITGGGTGLTRLPNGKQLHAKVIGSGPQLVVCIHGLGGDTNTFSPLLRALGLASDDDANANGTDKFTLLLPDLEGHGRSPTRASSVCTIDSYAADLADLLTTLALPAAQNPATLIAHSMGSLVALTLASAPPANLTISTLILLSPARCPLPAAAAANSIARAAAVRREGMPGVARAVAVAGTSAQTKAARPLARAAVEMSLLAQDPEGYAKGCTALAGAEGMKVDLAGVGRGRRVLVVTGEDDKVSSPAWVEEMVGAIGGGAEKVILPGVGHWCGFEDVEGVKRAVGRVLGV